MSYIDIFFTYMCIRKKLAASEHRTRKLMIMTLMRYGMGTLDRKMTSFCQSENIIAL